MLVAETTSRVHGTNIIYIGQRIIVNKIIVIYWVNRYSLIVIKELGLLTWISDKFQLTFQICSLGCCRMSEMAILFTLVAYFSFYCSLVLQKQMMRQGALEPALWS